MNLLRRSGKAFVFLALQTFSSRAAVYNCSLLLMLSHVARFERQIEFNLSSTHHRVVLITRPGQGHISQLFLCQTLVFGLMVSLKTLPPVLKTGPQSVKSLLVSPCATVLTRERDEPQSSFLRLSTHQKQHLHQTP
jgi:hypothetical protein